MVEFVGGPALPYDPSYHLLWRIDKIRAAVRRERPDILEIHSPYAAALACLSIPRGEVGARTFFWHSDFIDTYQRVLLGDAPFVSLVTRPLWAWVRRIASACDRTIVTSAEQEAKLRRHGIERIERIPMGVDRTVFHPRPSRPRPSGEIVLIGAGRFALEKRWDVVIDAVLHLRAEGMPVRLVLHGDGPERSKLEARATEAVSILPFETDREALARALSSADVYVHGCPYETFGVAIAEAVACAIPIVVPDRGAAREHVRGPSGRVYEALDPRSCARAIRELLSMDPKERTKAAEEAARNVPSIEEHFDRTLALYASLLA
jgi:alpha-1,6-mannosyltransferase